MKRAAPAPWAVSAAIHVLAITTLLWYHNPDAATPTQREVVTPLVFYKAPPLQPKLIAPRIRPSILHSTPLHPAPAPPVIVKQLPPPPIVQRVERPKLTVATPEPVPQIAIAPPPTLQVKAPDLPTRPSPPPVPVKTGVFETAGQSPAGRVPSPRLEVQTGGFAGPEAPRGAAVNGSQTGAVHVGGFGDSKSATAQSGNGRQLVASAGFGSGTAERSGNGRGSQQVADAGFGSGATKAAPAARRAEAASAETPVEVLWKPKPVYTPEARAKKLEGDITLEVVFHAAGNVQVLRVVRGLGSGLDESARTAAEQIRFRPGKKDGVAVDRTGLVLITFELS